MKPVPLLHRFPTCFSLPNSQNLGSHHYMYHQIFTPIANALPQFKDFTQTALHQRLEQPKTDENSFYKHHSSTKPFFSLLGSCTNMDSLKQAHTHLIVHGFAGNLLYETKLVSLYSNLRSVEQGHQLFERIENPDLYSWKALIKGFLHNGCYSEILEFYLRMRQSSHEPDDIVFSIVLKACTELHDLDAGRKLHGYILKFDIPDDVVLTGLIDFYAKCGMIDDARQMFDEIPERNVVSWTSIIGGYVKNDRVREGISLFNQMRQASVEPNQFTLVILLLGCSQLDSLHQGKWVHSYMIKSGFDHNSFMVTSLLDMYVKCGTISDARTVFDELSTMDLVLWTAMISGYCQHGFPREALELFIDMKRRGIMPNSVTISSVLSASAQLCAANFGKSIHSSVIKLRLNADFAVKNALVDMYAKCVMIEDASYIFETMSNKDLIAWNAMMTGYSQNGLGCEALLLFNRMRSDNFQPDPITVVGVLSACSCLGALQVGSSLHAFATKTGFLSNIYVGTSLLNFYAKCGKADIARGLFDGMDEKNMVTWSAMMGGYGMHGDANSSLSLLSKMIKKNLRPNDIIFTTILSACSHSGMVDEGWRCFYGMGRDYHVTPTMKHYTSMVDLLGRAGRLEDALEFIKGMPLEADVGVWGALLHGCIVHSRMDIGEVVVRRLLELKPGIAGYYVSMSNLYALDGRWEDAGKVRELMKEKGLRKFPGCSFVEMDNRVKGAKSFF